MQIDSANTQSASSSLYTAQGFYMVRTPALSARTFQQISAFADEAHKQYTHDKETALRVQMRQSYQFLSTLAAQPRIRLALEIASPSLLTGLERVVVNHASSQRVYASLLRYIIRMSTRPTPFGLFAGIAIGHLDATTTVSLGDSPLLSARARPDMHWLLALLQQLEEDHALVRQLSVTINQSAYLVGERIVLPYTDAYGQRDERIISFRATSVVKKVMDLACMPIPFHQLLAALLQHFPGSVSEQMERLLWQLWEHRFLISNLHPPLTHARPIEYISQQLTTLQGTEDIRQKLIDLTQCCTTFDTLAGEATPIHLAAIVQAQEALAPLGKEHCSVQVDMHLQLKATDLHRSVGDVVAQAAEILLRLSPLPEGPTHLQEYRKLFLEKYGEQTEVPLLDLLSPENGLDAPSGYSQPSRTYQMPMRVSPPDLLARDQILQCMILDAVNNRSQEVKLTPELIQQLTRWQPEHEQAPLSLDIFLQIHASSRAALDKGEWQAVFNKNIGVPSAGRSFGRFFDIMGPLDKEALQQLVQREEELYPDVIFAELCYQHKEARTANVTLRPALRSYEIVVGTTPTVPRERVITLSDLVVGVHNDRFYLRSQRLKKQVVVCQGHMLTTLATPNVCRFIAEVGMDGRPALSVFEWGRFACAPFLPRVIAKTARHATIVLAAAQWNLTASTIVPLGEGSEAVRWFQGVQHWREQWRVPRFVYLSELDNRLLLDLEHGLMVAELQHRLAKLTDGEVINIQELYPHFEHLWMTSTQGEPYFAELVVPLLRNDETRLATKRPQMQKRELPSRVVPREIRDFYPGNSWIYCKLYTAYSQHDAIIAKPLRDLIYSLHQANLIDYWFFIRYVDPEPHLRLRVHARCNETIQQVFKLVVQWSCQLAEQGYIQRYAFDTYEREVARYGGPAVIELVEQVFSISSAIATSLVVARYNHQLTLDPLLAAVYSLDHFFASWGYDQPQRLRWVQSVSDKYAFAKEFRSVREQYCELFSLWRLRQDRDFVKQRQLLFDLLAGEEEPLHKLGAQIRSKVTAGIAWVSEDDLLRSLAHMHKIRVLDLDRAKEQQMYAFWRHSLESLRARPQS